ncbi:thiamine biosynthesis lipoprotein [Mobilisporobacter senegalensis]|uniref:FAD:protein FMN transferase n=1 Tax=Mobilisporobacter senegalensis TaxID=1329262 RepID=A0A3N1XKS1_9FIRM|nr:FAD:protein FMN transferase [Mobilisporobacter senegalensis]ROR27305.1 thiamine biosynthesis lipoprotein [Mobilisporobacter senegalensis]
MLKNVEAQSCYYGMDTVITSKAYGRYAKRALKAAAKEALRLEKLLSRFIPESDISRINRSAGLNWEQISDDTLEVLSQAGKLSNYSKGLLDITIAPLVDLWRAGKDTLEIPDDLRIKQLLPLVDHKGLELNFHGKAAILHKTGQAIDLGGIGKGYAGDKLLKLYKKYDISSAFVNIGGNVLTLGRKPDGSKWQVGISHPREENHLIGTVEAADKAVVTSGDYQRYFKDSQGKRQHHILDPSTGYPAESGLVSVTIVSDSSTAADGLSTVLFVAGKEQGIELLKNVPNTEAIFIDTDLVVHITAGLTDCFHAVRDIKVKVLN